MSCILLSQEKPKGHSGKEYSEQRKHKEQKVPDKWTREVGKWVPSGDSRRHWERRSEQHSEET